MAKSYSVNFSILGSIDPSLLAAIQNAQKSIKSLSGLNGKALQNAQRLSAAQAKLNNLSRYKETLRAVQAADKARAGELLTANKTLAQQKAAQKQLEVMKRGFNELVKVQSRLKADAQSKRDALDLARADLKAAKKTGDANAIRAAQQNFQAQQESARRAAAAVRDINNAVKLGRAELKGQEQSVKTLANNFAQASAKAQQLQQQLQQQHAQLNQLRAAAPSNLGQAETKLRAEIQATTAALNQQLAALERRNQTFSNFSQRQQDLANAYSNFQNSIDTARQIMTPFEDAAQNAMTFEFAMSKVRALTSMQNLRDGKVEQVEKDMAALTAQAEHLGATTEFTSTEVAKAMGRYGYSGWNAQQIQAVMAQTVDFASVTGKHDIDRAADIFSDDLTILGIKAGDKIQLAGGKMVDAVSHTFDNYAYAITKANLDEEALHTSLTYNAPAMMLAGLTQGEIFASNMIAANAGLKGSVSGTAFRTGWIRMLAPPKKGAKALEELGMTATESQKQMAAASEAFAELGVTATSTARERLMALKTAWDANEMLGEEGRGKNAAMLDAIIGKNAFSTWANLFKGNNLEQMFEWADYMDSGKTAGWNADTASVMRDNTQTAVELLKSSMDALQRATGDALLPTIRGAAEMFAPLISSAAEFVAQNPALIQACAAIAAAISAATVAIAGFSLAMAGVRFAQAGWATASLVFGDLATKVATASAAMRGLTLANIGAGLSSGLTAAANAARLFGAAMLSAARAALAFVFTPVGAILTALALAAYYAYENWDRVAPAISRVADILNNFAPAVDTVKNALSTLGDAFHIDALTSGFGNLIDMIGGTLVGAIITAAGTIATVLTTAANLIANIVNLIANAVDNIINIFKAISEGDLGGIGDALKNAVTGLGDDLYKIGSDFVNNISDGLSATADAVNVLVHPTQSVQGAVNAGAAALPTTFDTSAAQVNIDALGSSAQNAATQMQGVQNIGLEFQNASTNVQSVSTNIQSVSTEFQNASTNVQSVSTEFQNASTNIQSVSTEFQNVSTEFQNVSTAAQTSTEQFTMAGENAINAGTQFQTAGDAALMSVGGFQALVDGASAVAGALSAKAGEIAGIVISVPQVNYVPMTIGIPSGTQHLASGGIYQRGAFLTTFAEEGPEAAIPLDKSARAINLWTRAGQILGVLPENKKTAQSPLSSFNLSTFNLPSEPARAEQPISINITVNIAGKADEQVVRQGIEQALPRVRSFAEELAAYRHEQARRSFL